MGQRRKKTYRIGMPIKVTVVDANKDAGTVDFAITKKPSRFSSGRDRFSSDRRPAQTRKPRENKRFGDKKDKKPFTSQKRGKFDGSKPTRVKQGDKKPFFKGKSTGRKMTHGRKDV